MQTNLSAAYLATREGQRANEIFRSCVHCGFCNASCPTYQLTGNELDGPRGRIYLIKQLLENAEVGEHTTHHLDRCLSCLSCETSCPSGVNYAELFEIGQQTIKRNTATEKPSRSLQARLLRTACTKIFPYPNRFRWLWYTGQLFRAFLPNALRPPQAHKSFTKPTNTAINASKKTKMIVFDGCVQSVTSPHINQSLRALLSNNAIQPQSCRETVCCGAIEHHNGAPEKAKQRMKQNIDAWWPLLQSGTDAIIVTASGCGSMIKDYARILADDPDYADKAACVSSLCKDACEIVIDMKVRKRDDAENRIAFHPPCTLQHGQQLQGYVEKILGNASFELVQFDDSHICCGSAGTYSLLQRELAQKLKKQKLHTIENTPAECIASANIGCLLHLQNEAKIPVKHWLELICSD